MSAVWSEPNVRHAPVLLDRSLRLLAEASAGNLNHSGGGGKMSAGTTFTINAGDGRHVCAIAFASLWGEGVLCFFGIWAFAGLQSGRDRMPLPRHGNETFAAEA